jgi:hypothetical protein
MVIHINPNRVNLPSGKAGDRRQQAPQEDDDQVIVPSRAHVNFIPAPESMRTLIAGAVSALRKGVRWDRGTILNLLV